METAKGSYVAALTMDASASYSQIITRYPLMEREEDAKKRLAAIQQASNERLKGLKELRTLQKNALAEFQGDANGLLAMLGGGESTKG